MNAPLGVEQGVDDVEAHVPDVSKERKMAFRLHCSCSIILDWLAALACLVLALGLEKASPKHRFVLKETLYWNSFPHKHNTVPSWSVPVYALVGPLALMLVARFVQRRPWIELSRLWAALCLAFFLTGAITNCLKLPVGRLRPNFVRTCWPNGTRVYTNEDEWGGYAVCDPSVPASDLEEIRKSWPSGHSSLSAAGLGFTSLYLLGQLRPFSHGTCPGRLWRLLVALLPSFGAVAVGVTRVLDYWHFTSDVVTGLVIGFISAFAVYRSIYPGLTDPRCNLQLDAILAERATSRDIRRVEAF